MYSAYELFEAAFAPFLLAALFCLVWYWLNKRHPSAAKEMALGFLVGGIIVIILIALITSITNYYAATYPYATQYQLPVSVQTNILNIYNGYSEQVTVYTNGSIVNGTGVVRQIASSEADSTSKSLFEAYMFVSLCALLQVALSESDKLASKFKRLRYLPIFFVVAVVLSQYILSLILWISSGSVSSGISLFEVDSLATLAFFGALLAHSLYRFSHNKGAFYGIAMKLLAVFMLLLSIVSLIILLGLVGVLPIYPNLFLSYGIHTIGLIAFCLVFIVLANLRYIFNKDGRNAAVGYFSSVINKIGGYFSGGE